MSILHPEYNQAFEQAFASLAHNLLGSHDAIPDALYHYTPSLDAVQGIAQHREIWLTNIAYLNDVAELDYIKSFVNDPKLDPSVKGYLERYAPMHANFGTQVYVMSFSTKPDYLPLWATFTKMKGYCMGFDACALASEILSKTQLNIDVKKDHSATHDAITSLVKSKDSSSEFQGSYGGNYYLAPVLYDREKQLEILNAIVAPAISNFESISTQPEQCLAQSVTISNGVEIGRIAKDARAFDAAVNKLLDQCATLFKSADFAYEHEWRLVKHMDTNNSNLLRGHFHVREVGGTIVPYIKMGLRNNLSFPLRSIISAPLALSDTTEEGLSFILYNSGYHCGYDGVQISKSKIKLRRF